MCRRNESQDAVILWLFRSFASIITVENEFLDHRFILVAFLIQASAHRDLIANWCRSYHILIQIYSVGLWTIAANYHLVLLWNYLLLLYAHQLIEQLLLGNAWCKHVFRFLLGLHLLLQLILGHLVRYIWIIDLELDLGLILRLLLLVYDFLFLRFISPFEKKFLDFVIVDVVLFRFSIDWLLLRDIPAALNRWLYPWVLLTCW